MTTNRLELINSRFIPDGIQQRPYVYDSSFENTSSFKAYDTMKPSVNNMSISSFRSHLPQISPIKLPVSSNCYEQDSFIDNKGHLVPISMTATSKNIQVFNVNNVGRLRTFEIKRKYLTRAFDPNKSSSTLSNIGGRFSEYTVESTDKSNIGSNSYDYKKNDEAIGIGKSVKFKFSKTKRFMSDINYDDCNASLESSDVVRSTLSSTGLTRFSHSDRWFDPVKNASIQHYPHLITLDSSHFAKMDKRIPFLFKNMSSRVNS